jgi:hypothetical protein
MFHNHTLLFVLLYSSTISFSKNALTICKVCALRSFFSAIFGPLSKCPTLLSFYQFFEAEVTKAHTSALPLHSVTQLNQSVGTAAPVRGLTLQIASALGRRY